MNSKQWTTVLWIAAVTNVFFGFCKLTESKPEAAIAHFVIALLVGFYAWRRGKKSG